MDKGARIILGKKALALSCKELANPRRFPAWHTFLGRKLRHAVPSKLAANIPQKGNPRQDTEIRISVGRKEGLAFIIFPVGEFLGVAFKKLEG